MVRKGDASHLDSDELTAGQARVAENPLRQPYLTLCHNAAPMFYFASAVDAASLLIRDIGSHLASSVPGGCSDVVVDVLIF